jgi:hypothetical protein
MIYPTERSLFVFGNTYLQVEYMKKRLGYKNEEIKTDRANQRNENVLSGALDLPDGSNSWRLPSTIAVIGFIVFLSVILLMHFVNPEVTFWNHYVSEYVHGEHGWILNIAITGNLIGSIAFIIAIYRAYPPPYRSMTSIFLYGIVTAAILTNYFPIDPSGETVTLSGQIHNLGGFFGGLAGLAFFCIHTIRLRSFGVLLGFYRILLILTVSGIVLFIVVMLAAIYADGIIGVIQRIYALVLMSWLIIAANGMRTDALIPKQSEQL